MGAVTVVRRSEPNAVMVFVAHRFMRCRRRSLGLWLVAILFAGLAVAAPARAQTQAEGVWRWRGFVTEASLRFGIPTLWIERVMHVESAGRTMRNGLPIRSRAGAMGLMQLMPATWADMRAACELGSDPDDPRDNILAGTAYLRAMYDRFGYPGLFGAYNAGPARYAAHLAGRGALPQETVVYLARVAGRGAEAGSDATSNAATPSLGPPVDRLFALRDRVSTAGRPVETSPPDAGSQHGSALFAIDRHDR